MWIHVYPNWKMNFNSKKGSKRSFSYETKASISFIAKENVFMMPNHEMKRDCYVNPCLFQWKMYFNSKKGNKRSFSYKTKSSISLIPKHQYHVSQSVEHYCHANNKKNGDCYEHPSLSHFTDELWLWGGKHGKKSSSCNSKPSMFVSQCGERYCRANNKKNRYYYEYPSLSHFTNDSDYKENGGKKAFLGNPKHQYRVS